jgi:hypothetical protein
MRLAVLKYDLNGNIGDEIQTLAAERLLSRVDARLDRDTLKNSPQSERTVLLMNGWFARVPTESFPPAKGIDPVLFSFHIAKFAKDWTYYLTQPCVDYFRAHQPVGCRDRKTAEHLREKGIDTYYTKCLTLTFPRRTAEPKDGKVFIVDVDVDLIRIPRELRRGAIRHTHTVPRQFDDELKRSIALRTLEMYRDHAKLVITSRLHCALPCAAMGIPVIFLGNPEDGRISLLEDIGIKINPYRQVEGAVRRLFYRRYFRHFIAPKINWNPTSLDLETEKTQIQSALQKVLQQKGVA